MNADMRKAVSMSAAVRGRNGSGHWIDVSRCIHGQLPWSTNGDYRVAQMAGVDSFDIHGNKRLIEAARVVAWSAINIAATGKERSAVGLPRADSDEVGRAFRLMSAT